MILADGLILASDGAKTLYLIEPDPSTFNPLAKAELLAEQKSDDPGASSHGTQTGRQSHFPAENCLFATKAG